MKNPFTVSLQPEIDKNKAEITNIISTIAGFYNDVPEAVSLLQAKLGKEKMNWIVWKEKLTFFQRLLASEKLLYNKRKKNGVKGSIGLLKIALDESSPAPKIGRSLGAAAYQAEARYTGRF